MESIESISAPNLKKYSFIEHGFLTNAGGYSSGEFSSLNTGLDVGDDMENVIKNRDKIRKYIGCKVALVDQDHTTDIYFIDKNNINEIDQCFQNGIDAKIIADAIITNEKDIALTIETADCIPILLCAPDIEYIAAIHSGWKGSIGGISQKVIEWMISKGANPEKMSIACGPSIVQESYIVQKNFMDNFIKIDPKSDAFFDVRSNNIYYNNKGYVISKIASYGISDIFDVQIDTFVDKRFFSHRGGRGNSTGRFMSFIKISK